jgi:hypothetical protein
MSCSPDATTAGTSESALSDMEDESQLDMTGASESHPSDMDDESRSDSEFRDTTEDSNHTLPTSTARAKAFSENKLRALLKNHPPFSDNEMKDVVERIVKAVTPDASSGSGSTGNGIAADHTDPSPDYSFDLDRGADLASSKSSDLSDADNVIRTVAVWVGRIHNHYPTVLRIYQVARVMQVAQDLRRTGYHTWNSTFLPEYTSAQRAIATGNDVDIWDGDILRITRKGSHPNRHYDLLPFNKFTEAKDKSDNLGRLRARLTNLTSAWRNDDGFESFSDYKIPAWVARGVCYKKTEYRAGVLQFLNHDHKWNRVLDKKGPAPLGKAADIDRHLVALLGEDRQGALRAIKEPLRCAVASSADRDSVAVEPTKTRKRAREADEAPPSAVALGKRPMRYASSSSPGEGDPRDAAVPDHGATPVGANLPEPPRQDPGASARAGTPVVHDTTRSLADITKDITKILTTANENQAALEAKEDEIRAAEDEIKAAEDKLQEQRASVQNMKDEFRQVTESAVRVRSRLEAFYRDAQAWGTGSGAGNNLHAGSDGESSASPAEGST